MAFLALAVLLADFAVLEDFVADLVDFLVFAVFLAAFVDLLTVFAVVVVVLLFNNSVAFSRVRDFGSISAGILMLFGLGRPLPEAGFMAGPLIYGQKGPLIILTSPQSAIMEDFFF